jgi:catechol 2,3-dioxygenase-like lactoylglutathione lyase family enzyme
MTKIVLWVSDLDAQIAFYSNLLELKLAGRESGFAELTGPGNSVMLHELPLEYRATLPLTAQLPAQTEVAIKPVCQVADLDAARERLAGTLAKAAAEDFTHGQSSYLDVLDPEGNIIQLEQRL